MSENAVVTTTSPDGSIESQECAPDDYIVVTGPDLYISHIQVYGNGTRIVTIKKVAAV